MPLTFLGLEVSYCTFCGSELKTKTSLRNIWLECPKRNRFWTFFVDERHSLYWVGPVKEEIRYDASTGKRL